MLAGMGLSGCQQIINYPTPTIATLSPTNVVAGQPTFTLTITGYHFTPASSINWNGNTLTAIFASTNKLTTQIPATLVQIAGTVQVSVSTPAPGGGTTLPLIFTINPATSPTPHITSLSPSTVLVGSGDVTLNVVGTNFVALSTVSVNNIPQQASLINSNVLQTTVPAAMLANAGPLQIAVLNPTPGGGSSNLYVLNVDNPVPSLTSLTPTSVAAGGASTTLSITGTGFATNSVIMVNGASRTTIGGGTQISTLLNAADLSTGGINQVQVVNSAPGGGTSNTLTFAVDPTITAGLPILVDYAFDGSQANNGVCGGLANCQSGALGLTLATSGPSVSQTGEFVAFASVSNNLVAHQTNSSSEIFVRDTCLGESCTPATLLVSVAPDGSPANGQNSEPSIDTAGAHVAYTSNATNLVNYLSVPITSSTRQVYWQPVCASSTTTSSVALCPTSTTSSTTTSPAVLVSLGADGSPGNGDSYNPVISPDGQYVAFVSLATNLVQGATPNGVVPQVYIRTICSGATPLTQISTTTSASTCTPTTYLVSSPDGVTPGNGPSSHPAIASAGAYVTFVSSASNLLSSAGNSGVPYSTEEIFEQSECELVTTGCTRTTSLISSTDGTTLADSSSSEPTMSSDGRFVAFASTATNLGTDQTPLFQQIYVRDTCLGGSTCTPATKLVSSPNGTTPANGLSENPSINQNSTGSGQFIAFASEASNLSIDVANGVENIYVRNTCGTFVSVTTTTCTPATVLASEPAGSSPPAANGNSFAPSISADGHTVGFLSFASDLVARDTDGLEDIFLSTTSF